MAKKKKERYINPFLDKKKGEFIFSYNPFGGAAAEGDLCRNCKKIIINYEKSVCEKTSVNNQIFYDNE